MECELCSSCSFCRKSMGELNGTLKYVRSKYCKKNSEDCARYIVYKALGRDRVPDDLFPGEKERAFKIIERFKGR